jgi:hypothetical protein
MLGCAGATQLEIGRGIDPVVNVCWGWRAIQAEKAVTQIDDAIRTQLLGLQRNLTNARAMSTTDPRSSRRGDVRQAVG